MTVPVPWSGSVHWIGAGLSNGSGVWRVADRAKRMVLWNRSFARAQQLAAKLDLTEAIDLRPYTLPALARKLAPGDIVVSMLPAPQHAAVLATCIERRAHFACSSYVSDAISELVPRAARAGVVVLAECGLDPGLDHLLTHDLLARARSSVDVRRTSISLRSYCGGIPAVPNEFRYQFSWAPLGVLTALRSPARFVEGFAQHTTARPWEETRPYQLGGETFEVYPNRDSLPFIQQYRIPEGWRIRDFVRGTLRPAGWREAWRDVFEAVETFDDARLAAFAQDLAARYPTTDRDRDRVVLTVELEVMDGDRLAWSGTATLDAVGDARESAMARHVSLPLACGVIDIADGRMTVGLHRAAETHGDVRRWLATLRDWGLKFSVREHALVEA